MNEYEIALYTGLFVICLLLVIILREVLALKSVISRIDWRTRQMDDTLLKAHITDLHDQKPVWWTVDKS